MKRPKHLPDGLPVRKGVVDGALQRQPGDADSAVRVASGIYGQRRLYFPGGEIAEGDVAHVVQDRGKDLPVLGLRARRPARQAVLQPGSDRFLDGPDAMLADSQLSLSLVQLGQAGPSWSAH